MADFELEKIELGDGEDVASKKIFDNDKKIDDATKVAQEHLEKRDNPQFLYSIIDSEDKVVFGIYLDGRVYIPRGIPSDVQKALSTFLSIGDIETEIIDSEKPIAASAISDVIDTAGKLHIHTMVDAEGRVLEYTDKLGLKALPETTATR